MYESLTHFQYDEPASIRHGGVRRIPHTGSSNRALGGPRSRRSNMHFNSAGTLSALSPAGRDSVDPISELLSQLTGVRRGAPQPSQLQQLQMQIQLERQQVSVRSQAASQVFEMIEILNLIYLFVCVCCFWSIGRLHDKTWNACHAVNHIWPHQRRIRL